MPRDYAKSSSREKARGQLPGWVWMMGGLAIGLFVAFIVYLNNITRVTQEEDSIATVIQDTFSDLQENARKREQQQNQSSSPKQTPSEKPDTPKTSFDFYYILPELEVAVPDRELATRTEQAQASKQDKKTEYIIQAGAFRKAEQADNLKAKLALHGIVAYIQTVNVNTDTWHRVRIGPVNNINQLNQTRKRLRDNGIDSIVIEPKT
ncbi:MAG: SPOR domain-containing protein [Thioalkalispiraceae bacterium]|jgi:cell division protein FtsN